LRGIRSTLHLFAVAPRQPSREDDGGEDGVEKNMMSEDLLEGLFAGQNPVDFATRGLEEARRSAQAQAEELAAQFAEGADGMSRTAEELALQFAEGAEGVAKVAEEGLQAAQKSVDDTGKRFTEAQAQWAKFQADVEQQWREGPGKLEMPEFKWPTVGDTRRQRPVERSRTDAAIKFLEEKWEGKAPEFGKRSDSGAGGSAGREKMSAKQARQQEKPDLWFEFWSSTVAFILVTVTSISALFLSFRPPDDVERDDDGQI